MLLDKSSCALLRYLVHLKEPETIMTISQKLNQSRRKIYYHLAKINASIPHHVEPIESIPRVGIVLNDSQKIAYHALLKELDSYSYVMDMSERIQLMILFICIADERVTLEKIIGLTEVSRNTVLSDLNEVRQILANNQYHISLRVSKALGYHLSCHPLNKIQYMHALLYSVFLEANKDFVVVFEAKLKAFVTEKSLFSDEMSAFLIDQVHTIERDLGKKINHNEIAFMLKALPYLLLGYRNMSLSPTEKRQMISDFSPVKQRIEYRVARQLQHQVKSVLGVEIDDIEVYLISILLLSYRKDSDIHVSSKDFADLKAVIQTFIAEFEALSLFRLEKKEELVEDLLAHCKALMFRKTYGILSQNTFLTDIKEKYQLLFHVTKAAAKVLEDKWHTSLSDSDIAYLTIHLGGSLRKNGPNRLEKRQIAIVCDEGVSVQKLLLKQCGHYLPHHDIIAVFTTEQFKSVEDILDLDFVITTSDALETPIQHIMVKPILDFNDILSLTQMVSRRLLTEGQDTFVTALSALTAQYISDDQSAKTFQERLKHLIAYDLLPNVIGVTEESPLF